MPLSPSLPSLSLRSVRPWQWVLLSLAVGALVGWARLRTESDLAATFGRGINGQRAFEQALLDVQQGRPRFTDLRVHARQVPGRAGGTTRVYVVSGLYFDGHYERQGGKLIAEWRPAFFLSDADKPYKPTTRWDQLGRPDLQQRFESIAKPKVADFLDCLADARGVSYTRAWWLGRGVLEWTAASFVVLGLLWPACVNLLVFGSLRRPPEEKGVDLSKVRARAVTAAPTAATDAALDRIAELGAQLEAELDGDLAADSTETAQPPVVAPAPQPVRKLKTEALAAAPTAAAKGPEFGTKEDDYYPTTLHPTGRDGHHEPEGRA